MNEKLFEKGYDVAEGTLNNDITLIKIYYQQGLSSLGFGLFPLLFVCFVLFTEPLVFGSSILCSGFKFVFSNKLRLLKSEKALTHILFV